MFTAIAKIIDHAAEPRMYAAAPYPPRHPHAVRCSRRDGAYDGGLGGLPKSAQMASRTLDVGGALGPFVQAVLNTRRVPGFVDRHYLVFEPKTAAD
jgi:hypothetical protein